MCERRVYRYVVIVVRDWRGIGVDDGYRRLRS